MAAKHSLSARKAISKKRSTFFVAPLAKATRIDAFVEEGLGDQLHGYVAVTDSPRVLFVEELMEFVSECEGYVHDEGRDDWWRSMKPVVRDRKMSFLRFAFHWLPAYAEVLGGFMSRRLRRAGMGSCISEIGRRRV